MSGCSRFASCFPGPPVSRPASELPFLWPHTYAGMAHATLRLAVHLLGAGCAVSTFWLFWVLWLMLLWTLVYNYRCDFLLSIPLGKYPRVELLDHMVAADLIFRGAPGRCSTAAVPFHVPVGNAPKFQSLHILTSTCHSASLPVLPGHSCVFSGEMSIRVFCPLLNWVFLGCCRSSFSILGVSPWLDIWPANTFSHAVGCLFTLLNHVLWRT